MHEILEMNKNVTRDLHHKINRFCAPLVDYLEISHFYHWSLTNSGQFVCVGLNQAWEEYFFAENLQSLSPYIRHPDNFCTGISSMNIVEDTQFSTLTNIAKETYHVNLSLHIINKTKNGMETYGFATNTDHPIHHMKLINELPLLRQFIKRFRQEIKPDNTILLDNRVDIASQIGSAFYKTPLKVTPNFDSLKRKNLLQQLMGEPIHSLTNREQSVIKLLLLGYSASQIAERLFLSKRTIEHHIERIKNRLNCFSKSELIQKARKLEAFEEFNI